MPKQLRSHCASGHDRRLPGAIYKNGQCVACKRKSALARHHSKKNGKACSRCGETMSVKTCERLGKERQVSWCASCAKTHPTRGFDTDTPSTDIRKTNQLLRLGEQLERALPWERDEIRRSIEWWTRSGRGQEVAAP